MGSDSFLLYVSQATTPLEKETHLALREKAVLQASQEGITGLLLFRQGFFLQYLEGTGPTLHELFRQIRGTYRHFNVRILSEGSLQERLFSDWSARWVKTSPHSVSSQALIELFETVLETKNPSKNEIDAILRRFGKGSIPLPMAASESLDSIPSPR